MHICLCVSVCVNMYLRVWYHNSSSKIILYIISVVGDYKSFNNFPEEIISHYPKHVLLWDHKARISNPCTTALVLKNLGNVIYVIHIENCLNKYMCI